MPRNAKWFEWVRGLAMDEQTLLGDIIQKHEEIMITFGNGGYSKNDGFFIKDNMDLRDLMSSARALGKKVQEVLEDNNRTAADLEREVLRRTYRTKR